MAKELKKIIKKNRANGIDPDDGLSLEAAHAIQLGSLVYVKKRNAFVRVKEIRFGIGVDAFGKPFEGCEIELADGEKVSNADVLLAPKDTVEGTAPF